MAIIGYARVSTKEQDNKLQLEALKNAGCIKLFSEKQSGTSIEKRSELANCLNYMREGDALVITRIDRLARSLRDLKNLVYELKAKGIALKAIEQPVDTSTAAGKAFLDMLGVFAEFETNIRKERQLEGIARAKEDGRYLGRKPTARAKSERVLELVGQGVTKKLWPVSWGLVLRVSIGSD